MLAMDTLSYLEDRGMKVERNLNFATLPNEEDDFGFSRKKTARDPMSHRIIEKRRRDRMNNCLADLSRLVPTNYLKKGRGRIEKTEIIEMAIKHLKHLQAHPCKDPGSCEVAKATEQDHKRQFRQGYQECLSETMKFMMEVEGSWMGDGVGIRLVNHLQKHYDKLSGGLCYTQALNLMSSEESKSVSPHMEVDNNHSGSCFPQPNPPYYELKHEVDGHHHHHHPQQQPPASKVTSQLREMLQNPGLPKDHHHQHHHDSPKAGGEEGCYKFKNNIKHRFHADLRHHNASPPLSDEEKPPPPPVLLCGSSFSPSDALSVKVAPPWEAETASSCGSTNPSPPPGAAAPRSGSSSGYSTNGSDTAARSPGPGVPVFALHPKGAFYIPLTLEASLLLPYLSGVEEEAARVLHPVSICVNLGAHSPRVGGLLDTYAQPPPFYPASPHHHHHKNGCA